MEAMLTERRAHQRFSCNGVITLAVQDGELRGTTLMGLMRDISEGGMGVTLDGGRFERGTAVHVECELGVSISAWVCHSTYELGTTRVGLSFAPVNRLSPEECFNPEVCEAVG